MNFNKDGVSEKVPHIMFISLRRKMEAGRSEACRPLVEAADVFSLGSFKIPCLAKVQIEITAWLHTLATRSVKFQIALKPASIVSI